MGMLLCVCHSKKVLGVVLRETPISLGLSLIFDFDCLDRGRKLHLQLLITIFYIWVHYVNAYLGFGNVGFYHNCGHFLFEKKIGLVAYVLISGLF